MWDFIDKNDHQPKYSQNDHHHNELRSKGSRKAVVADTSQTQILPTNNTSSVTRLSPVDQNNHL